MFFNDSFGKIVRWSVAFLCIVGVSACLDDEKLPFMAQLPYTSMEYPIEPGDTILVKGNGFDGSESVRIEGTVSDDSGVAFVPKEWNAEIVDVCSEELRFIVPEEAGSNDYIYVYLTHAGYEMELGSLTLSNGENGIPGGNGTISQYKGRVVEYIETERGKYSFTYLEDKLYQVVFEGKESCDEFLFNYRSSWEFDVSFRGGTAYCRLNDKGLLEGAIDIFEGQGNIQINREEMKMDIMDGEHHIFYHWQNDGSCSRIWAYDNETNNELWHMGVCYAEIGVPNDVNIDLNAPISFVFENELLNVLNMCGYLMPKEGYLIDRLNYKEGKTGEEHNASFSVARYVYDLDHRRRPLQMESQDLGSTKFWSRYMKVGYMD